MRKTTRFLSLLVLLMTAATGAWAQSATTHVVTHATVNDIFSGDGYTLGDAVNTGDVLDFQGTIDITHSLIINKPVNIISSKKDAVVKLNSASNTETPVNGDPGRAFVINKAGSGTTVQGIRIENTQTWLFNTSNVTFTGVTMWVEEATIGSGVGNVAIRYSDNITFDGCTVYAKNNGGTSGCILTGSHDCTFRNSRFEKEGNVGNILYIGNTFNVNDKPADYTMNADNISVLNCTITAESSGGISQFKISDGVRHHIENCTVNYYTSISSNVPMPEDGLVIRNNTFMLPASVTFPNYSTVEGNTITVNATGNVTPYVTFNQGVTATNNTITVTTTGTSTPKVNVRKGATVTGNTINNNVEVSSNSSDFIGSTITGNTINGTVTFAANSKNNTLTRNVITSTGNYAVVMAPTADANNTVQYNTLIAATKKGDEAVNPSTGTGNTISNNSNIALMLADGTKDAANWTATVNGEQPNPLPVGGLSKKDAVTLTYGGRLKVKSVTATTDAEPPAPVEGKFTINANGDQVIFAKGNLQATTGDYGANWTWGFAEHQYDYIGSNVANTSINGNGTVSTNGTVDLFGWVGTSGNLTGIAAYGISNVGYETSEAAYGNQTTDQLKHDWGELIGDGKTWRVLTAEEWEYVVNKRKDKLGFDVDRYAKATVNGVPGLILFPDEYEHVATKPTNINVYSAVATFGDNQYDLAAWTMMENAGCIFLPASSNRSKANVSITPGYERGAYWTSTPHKTLGNYSYVMRFDYRSVSSAIAENSCRYFGNPVRLVKSATDAEP